MTLETYEAVILVGLAVSVWVVMAVRIDRLRADNTRFRHAFSSIDRRVEEEREACAEIAETIAQGWDVPNDRRPFAACMEIADNIRLRSDQSLAAASPFQTEEAKER